MLSAQVGQFGGYRQVELEKGPGSEKGSSAPGFLSRVHHDGTRDKDLEIFIASLSDLITKSHHLTTFQRGENSGEWQIHSEDLPHYLKRRDP